MAAHINDFLGSFKKDVAKPSRFDVQVNIPLILAPYVTTARQLSFRCESAQLPGRALMTAERKIGSAPLQKVPYQTTYNDAQMTFIVTNDMTEKVLFDAWLEAINPSSNYNFNYKANYVSDILVNQYDSGDNLIYQVQLIDAFPIEVNQLDLNWDDQDYHKLAVVFAYTNWAETMVTDITKTLETAAVGGLINDLNNNTLPF